MRQHKPPDLAKRQLEQRFKAPAQQRLRGPSPRLQCQLCPPVVAHHTAAGVQRQQIIGLHIQKLRRSGEAQNPVVPVAVKEGGVFDVVGVHFDQLQRQVLAFLGLAGTQLGNVQHRAERARAVEDRCRCAGERDVGGVEVIVQMHRQRLPSADAGAHAAGAGVVLTPVGAEIEASLAQAGLKHQIAQKIHGDAARVCQQHHIAQACHLAVERFQPMTRNLQQHLHLVLVLTQPRLRQDDGFLHAGGVKLVFVYAAVPRIADHLLMPTRRCGAGATVGDAHHVGNVLVLAGGHGAILWQGRGLAPSSDTAAVSIEGLP